MNKFSSVKNLIKAKLITISPLEMSVKNNKKQIKKYLAINEASILRQSRQATSLSVSYGSKVIIKKLFRMVFLCRHLPEVQLIIYLSTVQF